MAFTPSATRTIKVKASSRAFDIVSGTFWDMADIKRPVGSKDPHATIDITFDWTEVLADIGGDTIANVTFLLGGLTEAGAVQVGALCSILVAGGTLSVESSITCRITTASSPARIEDRTIYLTIGEQ